MNERQQLEELVKFLELKLRNHHFYEVNNWLTNIDLSTLADTSIVGVLGITFWGKDKLPARKLFLEQAEIILIKNLGKERAEKLLKSRR